MRLGRAQPFGVPGKQEASAHAHGSEMLKTLPKTLTDGKQKSLIHEEGLAEAGATCGAVKLDQSDLGLHLTQRMDWKLHGKNTTPNRDCCVQENSAL